MSREEGPRAALGNRPPPSAPPYGARAAVAVAHVSSAYFDITESSSAAPGRANVALGLHRPHYGTPGAAAAWHSHLGPLGTKLWPPTPFADSLGGQVGACRDRPCYKEACWADFVLSKLRRDLMSSSQT